MWRENHFVFANVSAPSPSKSLTIRQLISFMRRWAAEWQNKIRIYLGQFHMCSPTSIMLKYGQQTKNYVLAVLRTWCVQNSSTSWAIKKEFEEENPDLE